MVRKLALGLVLWALAVGLSVSPAMGAAACASEHEGFILAPFAGQIPPPLNHNSAPASGLIGYKIVSMDRGQVFWLYAKNGNDPVAPCVFESCVYIPDFNIAFFKAGESSFDTQVGQSFSTPGPQTGNVPAEADYALVWLRMGAAAEFVFAQGCTGQPW